MLRFDKNQATNTNAIYVDTVNTSSGYYDTLSLVYSQSYDNSNGFVQVYPTSTPDQYKNYLVFTLPGTTLTTEEIWSGQYDVEVWTAAEASEGRWGFITTPWDSYNETWATAGDAGTPINFIASDRAMIVGPNQSSITQYVSSDENGTYTTYNG